MYNPYYFFIIYNIFIFFFWGGFERFWGLSTPSLSFFATGKHVFSNNTIYALIDNKKKVKNVDIMRLIIYILLKVFYYNTPTNILLWCKVLSISNRQSIFDTMYLLKIAMFNTSIYEVYFSEEYESILKFLNGRQLVLTFLRFMFSPRTYF